MAPLKPLHITRADLAEIRRLARASHPHEACGLLVGDAEDRVARLEPADNVADEPARRFEIDPRRLFALHKALRGTPERLIGHWHSHPVGAPVPSACDRERSFDPDMVWLILDGSGAARAWRPVAAGFAEVPLMEVA